MTVDVFNPPELALDRASFYARRAHLLDEIADHSPTQRRAIPVTALAVANEWWFFGAGSHAPPPAAAPVVVTSGTWDGRDWELIAYRTTSDDFCFTITPEASARSSGLGAAMNCGGFRTSPGAAADGSHGIAYLSGSSAELPTYIAGPVVDTAKTVLVYFAGGDVLRVRTVTAPPSLGAVRFYAAPVPESVKPVAAQPRSFVAKLLGLDVDENIVACLELPPAKCG